MKKTFLLAFIILVSVNFINAQNDSLSFNYFLKGNVGTKTALKVYTGSGKVVGTQYYEIVKTNFNCDTPEIKIKNYTTGLGRTAAIMYRVKSYNDTSYSELSEVMNVTRFLKSKVAELNPLWYPMPAKLEIGDTLLGYKLVRHYTSYDIITQVSERIVEGFETISYTGGELECVKISYTIVAKTNYGTYISAYTDWINKDIGIVKQEAKTKSGRVENTFLLEEVIIK
ncbi:MAG: hypothetical protein U9Q83_09980 [Bacteroidota bacterium]|nr:hypothetical protein [Bacteroidota bacterium]